MTHMLRLPDFLVIGAMKAGTTTLYRDLMTSPAIFFPADKEPESLANDEVLTSAGSAEYAAMFRAAGRDQVRGEASTAYTKLPDVTGVPARARQLLGSELKVIYIVRDPISRTISHHYHEASAGRVESDINTAVRNYPRLIDYSRYAMQITPWIEALGRERIEVICFEHYVTNRTDTVNRVLSFLGVRQADVRIDSAAVYNRSEGKPVERGMMARVIQSGAYRTLIRPLLPPGVKDRMRSALLPPAPPRPAPPTEETRQWLVEQLRPDVERLHELLGIDKSRPWWDLDTSPGESRDDNEPCDASASVSATAGTDRKTP